MHIWAEALAYSLSNADKKASKVGMYKPRAAHAAAFNALAPAWTHQVEIDMTLDQYVATTVERRPEQEDFPGNAPSVT